MQISVSTPVENLILGPLTPAAEHSVCQKSAGQTALAQGAEWRRKLEAMEACLLQMPQAEAPISHWFSRGVYAREMSLEPGSLLTGRIHKYSQINVLLQGEVSVLLEDGIRRICAPFIYEAPAGAKRVMFAHTAVRWLTICGTHNTNTETLVDELTAATYQEYEAFCAGLMQDKGG